MFLQLLLLTLSYEVTGEVVNSTLEFKEHSDYAYTKRIFGNVTFLSVDGVNISRPANGSHCVPPNDCWEVIYPERYLIAIGRLQGTKAAFTVQPVNPASGSPVAAQYKRVGTPDFPQLTNGARSIVAKELHQNEQLIHILLFTENIREIDIVGNITQCDINNAMISLLGKTGVLKFPVVLFTGHVSTKPRLLEINFSTGRVDRITMTPSNRNDATVPILTFIDNANAFKVK
nr:unnamed protein product [Spirometra erinaceieuropaei]